MAAPKKEIAFIDPGISDLETFIAALRPEVEAVVLSDHEPALRQMARAVEGREGIEAIHVIAHGWPGEVSFGSGALSLDTMDEYAAELAEVGRMLRDGAFQLWSCETAQGERGAAFVDALARATGAQVSAATKLVGAAAKGGCWELDAQAETAYARAPLTQTGIAEYSGVMNSASFLQSSSSGTEGGSISLGKITFSGSSSHVIIGGLPPGSILSDGVHTPVIVPASGQVDITALGWNPVSGTTALSVTPPNDANFSATIAYGNGHDSEAVTVNPLAPTVTSVAASGVEGSAIALNLGVTVNKLGSETNSLATLVVSAIPVGATISDGTNTFTATSGHTSIDIHTWNLASLTIKPANDTNFTLTVAATEKDAQGNLSSTTTSTEAVTVNPLAPTLTVAPVTGVEDGPIALSISAAAKGSPATVIASSHWSSAPFRSAPYSATGMVTPSRRRADTPRSMWRLDPVEPDNQYVKRVGNDEANFTLTVTATEKDAAGNTNSIDRFEKVTVIPEAPSVSASPATGVEGSPIALNISAAGDDARRTSSIAGH